MRSLPRIDSAYWLALSAASIFGTNTGDFVAGFLHLGHLAGLPWLLAAFLVILGLERLSPVKTPLWFWAAIITMRTAATNMGDAFHDFGIDLTVSVPLTLLVYAACVYFYARRAGTRQPGDDTVRVNPAYWVAMMVAGVLGTVGGDLAAFRTGLTAPGATVVFFALAAIFMRIVGVRALVVSAVAYWTAVGLLRTGGTAGGDSLAHAIGLPWSTLATGIVFVALALFQSRRAAVRLP
jgi:uncharacterized membrane-anchored protein